MNKEGITWLILIAAIILIIVFVFGRVRVDKSEINNSIEINASSKYFCNQDSDCGAASCCHSTECVNTPNLPTCKGSFCTMECAPGTLDCGQANCGCVNRRCTLVPAFVRK